MTGAGRGRGWPGVAALALATGVLSVVQPALLIFVPLALLLVALPPRRPVLLAFGAFIVWLAFSAEPAPHPVWYFERGWALVLGGWFIVMVLVAPRARFLPRALGAVAATAATAAAFLLANRGFEQFDRAVGDQLRAGASRALSAWTQAAGLERVSDEVRSTLYAAAELQITLYPALLALASLAALGVAWWAFARLARGDRYPLGRLREFRFRDDLVWVLIAGVLLLALPLGGMAARAGGNLLTFMAVLYALRGVAVLVMIGGVPGPLGLVLGALLVVILYPFVMATTFLVGLSDTWLDIRARRAAGSSPGS